MKLLICCIEIINIYRQIDGMSEEALEDLSRSYQMMKNLQEGGKLYNPQNLAKVRLTYYCEP